MAITSFNYMIRLFVDFAIHLCDCVTCRYAYSEDTNDGFDDEGPLTGSGARGIGDPLSKLERKERKNIDHTFVSAGDHEEDKRE